MSDKRKEQRDGKGGAEEPPTKKQHVSATESEDEPHRALAEIQDKLKAIDDECVKEQMQIQKKYDERKAPFFEDRQKAISKIDHFWGTALLKHGAMDSVVDEDKEFINALTCIELEDNLDDAGSYKIKLVFSDEVKEWLEPLELTKLVVFDDSNGATVKSVTPITFKGGKDPREAAQKKRSDGDTDAWSIFEWFSENPPYNASDLPEDFEPPPDLGEVIRRHFWHSPLEYFLKSEDDEDSNDEWDAAGEAE